MKLQKLDKKGEMSVTNVIGFIWACFAGILTLRITNPLYSMIFGLNWATPNIGSIGMLTKYGMMIMFGVFIFAVAFFIPFKAFTTIKDKLNEGNQEIPFEDDGR